MINLIVDYTRKGKINPSFKLAITGFSGTGIFLISSSRLYSTNFFID
jgi:hypothetical protein